MSEKDRFEVVSPSGARRIIVERQNYTNWKPTSGPARRVPGSTEFFTDGGVDASQNADGTFTTFDSEETFTRI